MIAFVELVEHEAHFHAGRVGQLEGVEEALVVGRQAEHAGHHRSILGHDPERAGIGATRVEHHAGAADGFSEEVGGQLAEAARRRRV